MIYQMKLNEDPFERMKNGVKTIEFRLYDDKRKNIKIGDKIEFSKSPNMQEKLLVEVIDIYRADTFEELFKKILSEEDEIKQKVERMYKIYSKEKEKEFGVIGIKIKLLK